MKAFVTGGAGFVGSHLVSRLLLEGWDVTIYDAYVYYAEVDATFVENLALRRKLIEGADIIKGSTLDRGLLGRSIEEVSPDVVVHLASLPIANRALRDSETAFRNILQGTYNILEEVKSQKTRFIYISSSMAYGNFAIVPVPEHAPMHPVEPYGAMKLAGEILTRAFSKSYGFPYIIIRPSAVYGPGDCNRRVVQLFLEKAIKGEKATIFSGNDTVMDFTFVEDLVDGISLAIRASGFGVVHNTFNVTRGEGRSLTDLASIIKTHVPDFTWYESEVVDARPQRGALDISRACSFLGYDPCWSLERGVAQYFDYMRESNPSLVCNPTNWRRIFG